MTKSNSDKIEELEEWKKEREIEDGAKALFTKWMLLICRTSTVAILGIGTWVGTWIANHFPQTVEAIKVLFTYKGDV